MRGFDIGAKGKQVVFDDSKFNIHLTESAIQQLSVNVKKYGAKGNAYYFNGGDGQYYTNATFTELAHDDTQAFLDALADTDHEVIVPPGAYLISNIEVPSDKVLKMETFFPYYDTTKYPKCYFVVKSGTVGDIITNHGYIENIAINGNNINTGGFGIVSYTHIRRCYVINTWRGIKLIGMIEGNVTNPYMGSTGELFVRQTLDDGMHWEGINDRRIDRIIVSATFGNGLVLKNGCGTNYVDQSKIEWSRKSNIVVEGWTQLIVWTDCTVDSANWWNLHIKSTGSAVNWQWNGGIWIGGRRDYNYLTQAFHTDNMPSSDGDPVAYDNYYSMILTNHHQTRMTFTGVYFRQWNVAELDTPSAYDLIDSIIAFAGLTQKSNYVRFVGCTVNSITIKLKVYNPLPNTTEGNTYYNVLTDAIESEYYGSGNNTELVPQYAWTNIYANFTTVLSAITPHSHIFAFDRNKLLPVVYDVTNSKWKLVDGQTAYNNTTFKNRMDVYTSTQIQALTGENLVTGVVVFDSTLMKPLIKTSTGWRDFTGTIVY